MNELKKLEIQFDKKRTIKILDERLDLYNTRYANSRQMLLHLIPFIIHLLKYAENPVIIVQQVIAKILQIDKIFLQIFLK